MMLRSNPPRHPHSGVPHGLLAPIRSLWGSFQRTQLRRALRLVLDSLDDRMLKDIGIARGEIDAVVEGSLDRRFRYRAVDGRMCLSTSPTQSPSLPAKMSAQPSSDAC